MTRLDAGNLGGKGPVATMVSWEDIPADELSPGLTRRLIWGDNQMLARFTARSGVRVPAHSHDNEQSTMLLSGRLRLTVDGGRRLDLSPGHVVVLPPGTPHEALIIEDAEVLESYSPPRRDWIDGDDSYLRNHR